MSRAGPSPRLLPDPIKARSPSARLVYISLYWYGWLTKRELAEMTGYSTSGIEDALTELREEGCLGWRWATHDTRIREYRLAIEEE